MYRDNETVGYNLVLDAYYTETESVRWMIDQDLILALKLIKEGNSWICPSENYTEVIKEEQNSNDFKYILIRREWLLDYLSARKLNLRMSAYCQRVENFPDITDSPFEELGNNEENREGAIYKFHANTLDDIFGGSMAVFKVGHSEFDPEEDAPSLISNDEDIISEHSEYTKPEMSGVRVSGEFWREEWLNHNDISTRVRGDNPTIYPFFKIETDGEEISTDQLNNEDIGRWLYFRNDVISSLLKNRGFKLEWCTDQTGLIHSPRDHSVHFGINSRENIVVYAYDIARLELWFQKLWQPFTITPDGGIGEELGSAQIKSEPADSKAPEELSKLFVERFAKVYEKKYDEPIMNSSQLSSIDWQSISRFAAHDEASLLSLAKNIHKAFGDRLNKKALLSAIEKNENDNLGSLKLLEKLCSEKIGPEAAGDLMSPIFGIYDLRIADAHPSGSKIDNAFALCNVVRSSTVHHQGYQLIDIFSQTIYKIGCCLFSTDSSDSKS